MSYTKWTTEEETLFLELCNAPEDNMDSAFKFAQKELTRLGFKERSLSALKSKYYKL